MPPRPLSKTKLAARAMPPAARPALDKALDSALNAVPPVPCFPLLLGFAMDQRMGSFISLTTALELIISFTFFKSSSYALVNIVTCEPNRKSTTRKQLIKVPLRRCRSPSYHARTATMGTLRWGGWMLRGAQGEGTRLANT